MDSGPQTGRGLFRTLARTGPVGHRRGRHVSGRPRETFPNVDETGTRVSSQTFRSRSGEDPSPVEFGKGGSGHDGDPKVNVV